VSTVIVTTENNSNNSCGQNEQPTAPIKRKDANSRRSFLYGTCACVLTTASLLRPSDVFAEFPLKETLLSDPSTLEHEGLEIEENLLKLLPLKNEVFRHLEKDLWGVSVVRSLKEADDKSWLALIKRMQDSLSYLDKQLRKLEPVFNQEDPSVAEITIVECGERLVKELGAEINVIINESTNRDLDNVLLAQKRALGLLAEIGGLLVTDFPYVIPTEGKFSYLPRLLGRAKVTFTVKRTSGIQKNGSLLGNVTIIADGFAAPVTAGNFVDLSERDFYTGLPVKVMKKKLGAKPYIKVTSNIADTIGKLKDDYTVALNTLDSKSDDTREPGTITTNLPILGSFNEGFYDPITAKPRRIPKEILIKDSLTGEIRLCYDKGYSAFVSAEPYLSQPSPVLDFSMPGLVGLNHPDKNYNGGSSEFFSLKQIDQTSEKVMLMNGIYAPFGYVIEGQQIMEELKSGDIITSTYVEPYGQMTLKKIRGISFANIMNEE
jgi:peptidylprolyl isomerase